MFLSSYASTLHSLRQHISVVVHRGLRSIFNRECKRTKFGRWMKRSARGKNVSHSVFLQKQHFSTPEVQNSFCNSVLLVPISILASTVAFVDRSKEKIWFQEREKKRFSFNWFSLTYSLKNVILGISKSFKMQSERVFKIGFLVATLLTFWKSVCPHSGRNF